MNGFVQYILLILIVLNAVAFVMYGIDKWKAVHHRWRISEFTLLAIAFFGGSLGAFMGMYIWRHKTKHKRFSLGVPLMLCVHIEILLWFFFLR